MKKKGFFNAALFAVLVSAGLAMAACPGSSGEEEDNEGPIVQVFTIVDHPVSRNYITGDTIQPLSVSAEASASEQLTFTYQWYSNTSFSKTGGTKIGGATADTYTPAISAEGEYFYYVMVTSSNPQKDIASSPARIKISAAAAAQAPVEFTISGTKYNRVRGVGGTGAFMFRMGTDAGASPNVDAAHINKLMGPEPDGIGANILRIMCQDEYEELVTNSIQSEKGIAFQDNAKNYFAIIRRANEYGAYVFANPWTAPGWMKPSGVVEGGGDGIGGSRSILKKDCYVAYADHLRDYLLWLNKNRAPIFALGILNEPDWGGSATYEGMSMSGNDMRDWFRLVGHFTTQRVTNESDVIGGAAPVYETSVIPGFGGGKATHHVITMNGDTMGDPTINDPVLNDTAANTSNRNVELFGRHYYAGAGRYTKLVGAQDTPWTSKPDYNYDSGRPEGWNGQREIWMTEYSADGDTPAVFEWPYVFDMLNLVDHALRVNDESAYSYWYSHTPTGFIAEAWDDGTGGWPVGQITTRGRAVAHFCRYVRETWRLGVTRTRTNNDFAFNPTNLTGNGPVKADLAVKISAYESWGDEDGEDPGIPGKFISVVMFTPVTPATGANGVDVGDVQLTLPEGVKAKSARAMISTGKNPSEYWQDALVVLAADGKSAVVNLPRAAVVSVKFTIEGR